MKILLTGCAGFIGMHLSKRLLLEGNELIGIDNLNHYYDVKLKIDRLRELEDFEKFIFKKIDISNQKDTLKLFEDYKFDCVINLAAQAGVRHSIKKPFDYAESNLLGFMNIIEGCRQGNVKKLLYASSSSVYGGNLKMPFSEMDPVNTPVSLYAATKRSNELIAHSYSHLYGIQTIGLRFFSVYGPWGRPDMAYFSFTQDILASNPINIFNNGNMSRDFTYIDDIVESVYKIFESTSIENLSEIINIGNSESIEIEYFIKCIERNLKRDAVKNYLPMQDGDVVATYADIDKLVKLTGFVPQTPINEGIKKFIKWYLTYYKLND